MSANYLIVDVVNDIIVIKDKPYNIILTEDHNAAKEIGERLGFNFVVWDTVNYDDFETSVNLIHELTKYYNKTNLLSFVKLENNSLYVSGYITLME